MRRRRGGGVEVEEGKGDVREERRIGRRKAGEGGEGIKRGGGKWGWTGKERVEEG